MEEDGYTPERVKAILRHPKEYPLEERLDVGKVLAEGLMWEDKRAAMLLLWSSGLTQAEALAQLGVKGRPSALFRQALVDVADALNGKGGGA